MIKIAETIQEWYEIMDEFFEPELVIPKYSCFDGKIYNAVGDVISDESKFYNSVEEFLNNEMI